MMQILLEGSVEGDEIVSIWECGQVVNGAKVLGIHDFSACQVVNGDSVHGFFLICCGNSHVVASVGAGKGPAGNYFIVLGNDVLDSEVQIGIAGKEG